MEKTTEMMKSTIPETTKSAEEIARKRKNKNSRNNWFTLKPNWFTLQSGNVETQSVSPIV